MGHVCLVTAHSSVTEKQAAIAALGIDEYQASVRQTRVIAEMLVEAGHSYRVVDKPTYWYPDYVNEHIGAVNAQNANQRFDLAIETHHNGGGVPDGGPYSCVLYWGEHYNSGTKVRDLRHSRKGKLAAELVSQELGKVVPWRNMGAKPHEWTGSEKLWLTETHCPAIITEPGFFEEIPESLAWYAVEGVDHEARAIARGILEYLKEV